MKMKKKKSWSPEYSKQEETQAEGQAISFLRSATHSRPTRAGWEVVQSARETAWAVWGEADVFGCDIQTDWAAQVVSVQLLPLCTALLTTPPERYVYGFDLFFSFYINTVHRIVTRACCNWEMVLFLVQMKPLFCIVVSQKFSYPLLL